MKNKALIALLVLLGLLFIYLSSIDKMEVKDNSMIPTLKNGDVIYVLTKVEIFKRNVALRIFPIRRNWIYVFPKPNTGNQKYNLNIKRCVAMKGDSVIINAQNIEIWDGTINYKKTQPGNKTVSINSNFYLQLDANEFFFIGDNFLSSIDSRVYGKINKENIVGIYLGKVK